MLWLTGEDLCPPNLQWWCHTFGIFRLASCVLVVIPVLCKAWDSPLLPFRRVTLPWLPVSFRLCFCGDRRVAMALPSHNVWLESIELTPSPIYLPTVCAFVAFAVPSSLGFLLFVLLSLLRFLLHSADRPHSLITCACFSKSNLDDASRSDSIKFSCHFLILLLIF